MKRNISKMDELEFDEMTYTVEKCRISSRFQLRMEWDYFNCMMEHLIERLDLVMPAKYQKGLIFKITTQLGAVRPEDCEDATWITVERGVKDWFITAVERGKPSVGDIHPVNLAVAEDNHDRLWSIIERVTSPGWFNLDL